MISSSELLAQRVELLERTYVGGSTGRKIGTRDDGPIVERVLALSAKLDSIGNDVPALQILYEQSIKLKPLIQQKKSSAVIISQRIDLMLAQKDAIERNFKQLTQIDDNAKYINSETFEGTTLNTRFVARLL